MRFSVSDIHLLQCMCLQLGDRLCHRSVHKEGERGGALGRVECWVILILIINFFIGREEALGREGSKNLLHCF